MSTCQKLFTIQTLQDQFHPDVIGLAEPNINWTAHQRQLLTTAINYSWPHHRSVTTSCPPDPASPVKSNRLQGGIAQITHGKHSGHISAFHADPLGRWSSQSLRLKNNKFITIITAYRPCSTAINPKSNTIIAQQSRYLRKHGISKHPWPQFLKDLSKFILRLKLLNHEIILGIDANLEPLDNDFWNFTLTCGLLDLFQEKFHTTSPTHKRGNYLDLILGTPFIMQHLVRIGITDSTFGAPSDHSVLFLDLHPDIFTRNTDPTSPSLRSVTSRQRSKFLKYGATIDRLLQESKFIASLTKQLDSTTDRKQLQQFADSLDQAISLTIEKVNNTFHRTPNLIAWSPLYKDKVLQRHRFLKYLRQYKNSNLLLVPLPTHIDTDRSSILKYLRSLLKTAETELRNVEKRAQYHRFQFLQEKLTDAYNSNDSTAQKRFKAILSSELRREAFRKLSIIIKGKKAGFLDRVIVTENSTPKEITDAKELFSTLLERNKIHFAQSGTDRTPFTQPPLSSIVPLFSSNATVTNNLLNNSLTDFPPLSNPTKAFLNNIASPQHIHDTVSDDLSVSDFINGIKRIPESKSSSASGRSYSVYRALSPFPDSIKLIVQLINLGKNNNIILQRWRTILQIMICKKPGNFNLNKLRVIQLLEADLNLYLRLIWGKRMVRNCIKHKQFPPEQLGNKPGCWGTAGPLLKVLSFDHIRLL